MSKAADFEKKWKATLGKQTENPNSVDWEQIAAATDEVFAIKQPANSFTLGQYKDKLGLTKDQAAKRIRKLVAAGRFEKLSVCGPSGVAYYVLCQKKNAKTRG